MIKISLLAIFDINNIYVHTKHGETMDSNHTAERLANLTFSLLANCQETGQETDNLQLSRNNRIITDPAMK